MEVLPPGTLLQTLDSENLFRHSQSTVNKSDINSDSGRSVVCSTWLPVDDDRRLFIALGVQFCATVELDARRRDRRADPIGVSQNCTGSVSL